VRIAIFGATSAIATASARRWASGGHSLVLIGRDPVRLDVLADDVKARQPENEKSLTICADLADLPAHAQLVERAFSALGGLDVILVAHGSLPEQAACEDSVELTLREINVNALSPISIVTLAAKRFEAAGAGVIAVISSVAGDRGRQSNYVYGAAKGMLSIFLDGLRNRLSSRGVAVITIKPGFVDTPMTAHLSPKGRLWATADQVATAIVKAVERREDVVYAPRFWRPIMFVIRHIPERIFKRMKL
jgi:decaprenylphospho-beta-D-erythro-pentofuranosid-2-ulose 2-reductase